MGRPGKIARGRRRGRGGTSGRGASVKRLRRDVGLIGPNDRAGLGIGTKATEVVEVSQRLEDATYVLQIRQIDIARRSILKADVDDVSLYGRSFD